MVEKLADTVITAHQVRRGRDCYLTEFISDPKKLICLGCDTGQSHVQGNGVFLLASLGHMLSKRVGPRITESREGGFCVCVCVWLRWWGDDKL